MTEYDCKYILSKLTRILNSIKYYHKCFKNYAKNHQVQKIRKLDHKYIDLIIDFSQTVYLLKEKLILYYPTDKSEIESFFNNVQGNNLNVIKVKTLANLWKHKEKKIEIYNCEYLRFNAFGISEFVGYEKRVGHVGNPREENDLIIFPLFIKCLSEIRTFYKSKKYM